MLVTGNRGFIGSSISTIYQGYDLEDGKDILNYGLLLDNVRGNSAIVHLAALSGVEQCSNDPILATKTNIRGSVNVLQAALETSHDTPPRRVLLASSGAVKAPNNVYAVTKRTMEDFGRVYRDFYGLNVGILRFTNIYGPGSIGKSSAIASFCKTALTHGEINIYGDGEQTRDFVYIGDVVDAIIDQATFQLHPVLQVGSGTQVSINTVAEIIASHTGAKIIHHSARAGDVRTNELDKGIPRYQTLMGLDEGIERTLEYFDGYF